MKNATILKIHILHQARNILLADGFDENAIREIDRAIQECRYKTNQATVSLSPEAIIHLVSDFTKVKIIDLVGKSKKNEHCAARRMAAYFIRKYYPYFSLRQIGQLLGKQGEQMHSTVHAMLVVAENELQIYESVRSRYSRFEEILKQISFQ